MGIGTPIIRVPANRSPDWQRSANTAVGKVARVPTQDVVTMDKIVALCKRRGLIFPASEIYGGIANTYDYGHYGVLLKRNIVDAGGQGRIGDRTDIVALDSAIIQHPKTWEASGHLAGFTDPLIDCKACGKRFR